MYDQRAWAVELRREESRGRLQDRVRPPQLTVLLLQLLEPPRLVTRDPRTGPRIDLDLLDPAPQLVAVMPSCCPTLLHAPVTETSTSGSASRSWTRRIARPLISSGYFFGAGMAPPFRGISASTRLGAVHIVGGIRLVDVATGEVREAKVVTGVDDHSRFCVMAAVVERATGRAVCLAFAQALAGLWGAGGGDHRQRQAVHRPVQPLWPAGEVLFDKICRLNGITHRLTAPASPNQNGKVERFHGTFRPEFLRGWSVHVVLEAQAAVDAWVAHYNHERPHQGLGRQVPVVPADRFTPAPPLEGLDLVAGVGLPPALEIAVSGDCTSRGPRTGCCYDCWGSSSSTRSFPGRGTCRCAGTSSGWVRRGRVRWCGSGSTASGCTSRSVTGG